MPKKQLNSELAEKISEKINKGEIKMKPKYYFVIGTILVGLGTLFSFLGASFFINLASHRFRTYRMFDYLNMGSPGMFIFLRNFPWVYLFFVLLLFISGAMFLRKYDISYKKSLLIILIGLFFSVASAGIIIDRTGINDHLAKRRDFGRLYKNELQNKKWLTGTIEDIKDKTYCIQVPSDKIYNIYTNERTFLPPRGFSVGECIRAVGELEGTNMYADGIMHCAKGQGSFPKRPPQNRILHRNDIPPFPYK